MFILLLLLVLAALVLVTWRRIVEERAIRWELYALRDELRSLAYSDRRLLDTTLFRRLDYHITAHCGSLSDVSIWSLLPVFLFDREGRSEVEKQQVILVSQLKKPENREVSVLYDRSVRLMVKHLLLRHVFLTAMAALTLFGILGAYLAARWTSERIVSGAFWPPVVPMGPSRAIRIA
jgi:hypothetical protein